jgi:hypothetical protein
VLYGKPKNIFIFFYYSPFPIETFGDQTRPFIARISSLSKEKMKKILCILKSEKEDVCVVDIVVVDVDIYVLINYTQFSVCPRESRKSDERRRRKIINKLAIER